MSLVKFEESELRRRRAMEEGRGRSDCLLSEWMAVCQDADRNRRGSPGFCGVWGVRG